MIAASSATNFQDVEPVFRRWSDVIASTLVRAGDTPDTDLRLKLVKSSHRALSYSVETGGRRGFIKLFDKHSGTGRNAYARERDALLLLRGHSVVPRHLAHCDEDCFVLSDYVANSPMPVGPEGKDDCLSLARQCGVWLAQYEAVAPARRQSGNWFEYLSSYDRYSQLLPLAQMQPWLQEIPLCGAILSRCDGSLENFLLGTDGAMAGCDFDMARFKPRGWDFAMTYQAFAARWPGYHEEALAALAAGFSSRHQGVLVPEELIRVARALFILEADTAIARG